MGTSQLMTFYLMPLLTDQQQRTTYQRSIKALKRIKIIKRFNVSEYLVRYYGFREVDFNKINSGNEFSPRAIKKKFE